jgi:hypothetical protein
VVVTDGSDGAIVAWEDFRHYSYPVYADSSIYAQRVRGSGVTSWPGQGVRVYDRSPDQVSAGTANHAFALQGVTPNPGAGPFAVRFTLPSDGAVTLEVFDLHGRSVARRSAFLGAGEYSWRMDSERRLAPGIYLVRLTQGSRRAVARACILR